MSKTFYLLACLSFLLSACNALVSDSFDRESSSPKLDPSVFGQRISSNYNNTCVVKLDGYVYCWGDNYNGQLGVGHPVFTPLLTPVAAVSGTGTLTNVVQVSTGDRHSCAVINDGTALCWGSNDVGRLGNGSTTDSSIPVPVLDSSGSGPLSNVQNIEAGVNNTCALKTDGTVYCWGEARHGTNGQGGGGATSTLPSQVVGVGGVGFLSGITQIAMGRGDGYGHACALKGADGSVYCWGAGSFGQTGSGVYILTPSPIQVVGVGGAGVLTGISKLVAGGAHTCGLKGSDGTIYCWGYGAFGQLGNGSNGDSSTPVQVSGVGGIGFLVGATDLASGGYHLCALNSDSTIACWGSGGSGQLGDGSSTSAQATPKLVLGVGGIGNLSNITTLRAGVTVTCGQKADSTLYCWGANGSTIGDGINYSSNTPVQVKDVNGTRNVSNFTEYSVGSTICVVKSTNELFCLGGNYWGEVGTGAIRSRSTPDKVLGVGGVGYLGSIVEVAVNGNSSACALKVDGTVYCWGANYSGQLGNNSIVDQVFPVQVLGVSGSGVLSDVSSITGGADHFCALKADATIVCWGANYSGQLGDNTTSDHWTPVQVKDETGSGILNGVRSVSASGGYTCALKTVGSVYCWGYGTLGNLGNNSTSDQSLPVQVVGLSGTGYLSEIVDLTAGYSNTCALNAIGEVFCWGFGYFGALGNNDTSDSAVPVQVVGLGGIGTLSSIAKLSKGASYSYHICAVRNDQTPVCWGGNYAGQLGDNTTTDHSVPVDVVGPGATGHLENVYQASSGASHVCALTTDESVFCWGEGSTAQLGNGSMINQSAPVQVVGVGGVGYF